MKVFSKAVAAVVLGGVVLGTGLPAMAKGNFNDCRDEGPAGRGPAQHRLIDPELMADLNLTQEQKAALWDLMQDGRAKGPKRFEDSKVRELMDAVHSGQEVSVGLKTEAQKEISGRIMDQQARVGKLYGILTAEQRQIFGKALKERGDEARQRFEDRAGQRGQKQGERKGEGLGQGNGQGQKQGQRQHKGQGICQGGDDSRGRSDGRRDGGFFMGRMGEELNLTDAQKEEIGKILTERSDVRRDRREEARKMREEHRAMFEMAWTADADADMLKEAADKAAADRVEHMVQGGETIRKIRSVLTEEQIKKLDELREDHRGQGPRGTCGPRR